MQESIPPLPLDGHSKLCIFVPAADRFVQKNDLCGLGRSSLTTTKPDMRIPHACTSILPIRLGYIPFYDNRTRRCDIKLIKETFETFNKINVLGPIVVKIISLISTMP